MMDGEKYKIDLENGVIWISSTVEDKQAWVAKCLIDIEMVG